MTFNDECVLIGDTVLSFDEYGNPIKSQQETEAFCYVSSVTRSEFYNANLAGYKLAYTIVVNTFEYSNEQRLRYNGKTYDIIRAYEHNSSALNSKAYKDDFTGYTELTVGEKIGGAA